MVHNIIVNSFCILILGILILKLYFDFKEIQKEIKEIKKGKCKCSEN